MNAFRVDLDCDIYITGSNSALLSGDLAHDLLYFRRRPTSPSPAVLKEVWRVLAPYFKEVAGGFHITKDAGLFICYK